MWFESFWKARENEMSLKEIANEIKQKTKEQLKSLKIDLEVTKSLHEWMKVVSWDWLHYINNITSNENKITWYDWTIEWKWDEANLIYPGDIIKIENWKVYKSWNKWNGKILIWKVEKWFQIKENIKTSPKTNWDSQDISQEPKKKYLTKKKEATKTEVETHSYFRTIWFTQNWENYIIWKDWEPKLITTQELTPEYKEALKEYKETLLLTENINLLLSALSQNWEDVSKFNTQLKNKINSFNPLELKKSVNEIKTTINSIFNNLDIDNKKEIDLKSTISVYKYIRDELDNYELVRKQIAEKEFNNLTKISQEELDAFIKNPLSNQEKIKNILWEEWFKDFQKEISEKKAEANTYYIDHQEELKEQFPNLDIESIQSFVIDSFVWSYSKIALMEAYIQKNMMKENSFIWSEYNWKGNENIDLFADIQGIWTYDISDKTTNIGIEWAKLIGTEIVAILAWMVTMWAWTLAVNAAVYGVRWYKGIKYLQNASRIANVSIKWVKWAKNISKLSWIKFWRLAAMSTIEGWSFYAGYATMQSWIEGENMYSMEWLYQSVAFMWAFKALNWLYKAAWLTLDTTKPLMQQKLTMQQKLILWKQLVWEGITFSALWLGFEWILFEPGEWTAETIIQAFVMAAAFKWAWLATTNFRFRRAENWKVEVVEKVEITEWASSTPISFYKNKITWETYTKTLDWSFLNSKWELVYKEWIDFIWNRAVDKNFLSKIQKTKKAPNYKWTTEAPIDKDAKPLNADWTKTKIKKQSNEQTNETIKEPNDKKINSLFEKYFNNEMNTEWRTEINWKIYKKRSDWKYEISWDNTLYTKKEILKKISIWDKKSILQKSVKEKVQRLDKNEKIKLKDGYFTFRNKYKVSKDEIIIKEKGKERKLTKEEESQFYKDHYEEILTKMWFNIKKDSEKIIENIKDKLNWSKWADMIKSINNFLESVPALWHIYKGGKWIWKKSIESILTPYNIVKNIKQAKWFEETLKSVIFADKEIGYLKWVWKVWWAFIIPTISEIIFELNSNPQWDMKLSWKNILANYWELMYLWVINTLIIESLNIDEAILNEKP